MVACHHSCFPGNLNRLPGTRYFFFNHKWYKHYSVFYKIIVLGLLVCYLNILQNFLWHYSFFFSFSPISHGKYFSLSFTCTWRWNKVCFQNVLHVLEISNSISWSYILLMPFLLSDLLPCQERILKHTVGKRRGKEWLSCILLTSVFLKLLDYSSWAFILRCFWSGTS